MRGLMLIVDLIDELRIWGYHSCEDGHLIFKTHGSARDVLARDALARKLGGEIVSDETPKCRSQSSGGPPKKEGLP